MVLGNVSRAASVAAVLVGLACHEAPAPPAEAPAAPATPVEIETFEIAGHSLGLWDDGGGCILNAGGRELDLDMAAPCRFLRGPGEQTPQTKTYPDAGDAVVAIVVGSPEEPGAPIESFVGRRSRGLLIRPGGVTLSGRISEGRWSLNGADEKEFWLFSH